MITSPFTAQDVINQTNQYRVEQGLPPVAMNPMLMSAAQERAKDMAETNSFSHTVATTTPNVNWNTFITNQKYPHPYRGENLAVNFNDATSTVEAWKNSPLHNKNLINNKYKDIGVAIVPGIKDGQPTYYVVQYFGGPMGEPTKPKRITKTILPVKVTPPTPPSPPPPNPFLQSNRGVDLRTSNSTPMRYNFNSSY